MILIRLFEEKTESLFYEKLIPGFVHLIEALDGFFEVAGLRFVQLELHGDPPRLDRLIGLLADQLQNRRFKVLFRHATFSAYPLTRRARLEAGC